MENLKKHLLKLVREDTNKGEGAATSISKADAQSRYVLADLV